MDKLKLKWRIFGFLICFCTLLLMILWLFQTVFLTDMYKWVREREITNAVSLVEENINNPKLPEILDELKKNKEIFVTPSKDFIPSSKLEEKILPVKVFTLGNGKKISFIFHATISPVNATISTLQVQLYIITGIIIILSILLAMVIAKRISKPIEVISGSAKGLASGSYNTHFTGKGFLEICELSDTLNVVAAELSKVENLRRELMANISHDLRTPLALIYSYAEMMQDFPTEITREQMQVILDETKRLSTLVSDVLDISKLESGMVELNMAKYNLTESLQKTISRLAEMIKKDGYTITFEPLETVNIFADETKIMQVFYNLLINVVNYSGKHKIITVRQNCVNNFVKIEVTDHGEGITPENLPYIWDRYYKANKTHKRATIGTGLGLSIVKKIIDLHAGNYGVDSEVGVGSTFWFSLKV